MYVFSFPFELNYFVRGSSCSSKSALVLLVKQTPRVCVRVCLCVLLLVVPAVLKLVYIINPITKTAIVSRQTLQTHSVFLQCVHISRHSVFI